jgi:Protein of unknown function (DUF1573)
MPMRWWSLLSIMLALSLGAIASCSPQASSELPAVEVATPSLSKPNPARELLHDFGMLLPGASVSHAFTIHNDSETAWAFESFQTTCGCTVAEISEEKIAPGQDVKVTVRYRAPTSIGDDQRGIGVTFQNAGPVFRLVVAAKVRNPVSLLPVALKIAATHDADKTTELFLCSYVAVIQEPVKLTTNADWLVLGTPTLTDLPTDDPAMRRRWKVPVTIRSSQMKPGAHRTEISTGTVPGQTTPTAIPVEVNVTAPIEVSSSQLFFGAVKVGVPAVVTLNVKLPADVPATDLLWDSDLGAMLEMRVTNVIKNSVTYEAKLTANGSARILKGAVRIKTAKLPATELPVFARVQTDVP